MTDRPKDPKERGALWAKTGRKGVFLSGTINGMAVICFPIEGGVPDGRLPSWRVLESDPPRKPVVREVPHDPGVDDPFGVMSKRDYLVAWVLAMSAWSWITAWPWHVDAAVLAVINLTTSYPWKDGWPDGHQ